MTQDLIGYPYVTVPGVSERYDYTYQAASNAVRRLTEIGILREVPRARQPKVYVAADVVRILDRR